MPVEIREPSGHAEMRELSGLFAEIWGMRDAQVIPKDVFVAAALSGHQLHAAFDGGRMVGGSWGFLAWDGEALELHSHITGVLHAYRGSGLGLALKLAQRDWCLSRGIVRVTWTFDPMMARNAAFNFRKLGARGVALLPDFYGPMRDRFNQGEPTDRVEVVWPLRTAPPQRPPQRPPDAAGARTVPVPRDFLALRESDPARARAERSRVREELSALFADGFQVVWFDERGYVLASSSPA